MHRVVLVLGTNDVESMMEPFNEEVEVEPWLNEPVNEREKKYFIDWAIEKDISMITKTEDEIFDKYIEQYQDERLGSDEWRKDSSGDWQVYSSYNPNGEWDWYTIGGRWENNLTNKNGNKCDYVKKKNFKSFNVCSAVVYNGEWIDEDCFGSGEEFKEKVNELISELPDDAWITSVDAHY